MKKAMNIAFSCDNKYAPYVSLTILNVLKFLPKNIETKFYILDSGIKKENKDKLNKIAKEKNVSIEYADVKKAIEKKKIDLSGYTHKGHHIPIGAYSLFLIGELFPKIDKILYLDTDILVLDNLYKVYKTDLSKHYAGVIRHFYLSYHGMDKSTRNGKKFDEYCQEFFNMDSKYYFNTGVMLFNLKNMRKDKITDKLFKALLSFTPKEFKENIQHNNQDIFNKVLYKKVKYLHLKYNTNLNSHKILKRQKAGVPKSFYKEMKEALQKPVIAHYVGKKKPWNDKTLTYAYYWWELAKETPFYQKFCNEYKQYQKENFSFKKWFLQIKLNPYTTIVKICGVCLFKKRF